MDFIVFVSVYTLMSPTSVFSGWITVYQDLINNDHCHMGWVSEVLLYHCQLVIMQHLTNKSLI